MVVPVMTVPNTMRIEPMNMPTRLPYVSMAGPTNGRAQTPPIWYIAETRPAQMPLFSYKESALMTFIADQGYIRRGSVQESVNWQ